MHHLKASFSWNHPYQFFSIPPDLPRPHVLQFSSVVCINLVYPDVYERFLSLLNVVNVNLGFILSISCIMDTNFYGRLLFATIGPLVVLGALAVTYSTASARNRRSPAGIQAAKHKHLAVVPFVAFIVYSSVSFAIFRTFVCETLDNGVSYLRADYSLSCSTATHAAMKVYGGVMVAVYPIGIPAVFAWCLFPNRRDLVGAPGEPAAAARDAVDHLQPMRDLWGPYKPHRYYYDVVEYGRRIALTTCGLHLSRQCGTGGA